MKVGVLAMQGAFIEHVDALNRLGIEAVAVRKKEELESIDGLIIPGGESTTIGKLLDECNLKSTIREKIESGLPVWGTCAGMIILAKKIVNFELTHIPLMDIEVVRNGYGRQLGSFISNEKIDGVEGKDFPMVFIRAPYIKEVRGNVKVVAKVDDRIVAAREKNMLVTSFHPELTGDLRMHKYFIDMI